MLFLKPVNFCLLTIFILSLSIFIFAGNRSYAASNPKKDNGVSAEQSKDNKTPKVIITTANGRRVTYKVEIASLSWQRQKGLMFRTSMSQDRGMLFLFASEEQQSFWMKHTSLPLDMIFIRDNLKILGVVHDAKPFDESSHYVLGTSRYVLEVNGGQAKKWGIGKNDEVEFVNIDKEAGL